ncbi:Uncharacterised protein [uncultured archaeon]|nr:Uncharacterised protein [uncultured archaeon]
MTVISAVLGYDALPPGIYAPTLSRGEICCPSFIPSPNSAIQSSLSCAWWNLRIFPAAFLRCRISFSSTEEKADSISLSWTSISFIEALSNCSVYLRSAASPFFLTSSSMGATAGITSDSPLPRLVRRSVSSTVRSEMRFVSIANS